MLEFLFEIILIITYTKSEWKQTFYHYGYQKATQYGHHKFKITFINHTCGNLIVYIKLLNDLSIQIHTGTKH